VVITEFIYIYVDLINFRLKTSNLLKSTLKLNSRVFLRYVSDLEDMFSSMMFIQFLSISLRICLMIFLITLVS
jgi:hypothetical protein